MIFPVAQLGIKLGGITQLGHDATVDVPFLAIVDHLGVEEGVAIKAVGAAVIPRQDKADARSDRPGDIGIGGRGVDVAIAQRGAAFEVIARLERLHDDRPGGGIAAIERALRPFEHFDLAQRALRLVEHGIVGLENSVDDQRDRTFGVARAVDPADVDLVVAGFGGAGDDRHPGGQLGEILRALDIGIGDRPGVERGDRCRHLAERFIDPPRRDHNLAIAVSGRVGGDRGDRDGRAIGGLRRGRRDGQCAHRRAGKQQDHIVGKHRGNPPCFRNQTGTLAPHLRP